MIASHIFATLPWWCNWPAFSGWERAEVLSAISVAIGCFGEMWWLFRKGPPKESFIIREAFAEKKEQREKLFAILIAAGVMAEVITLLHSLKESGELRVGFAKLERENLLIKSNLPTNQPLHWASAVMLFRLFENLPIDPHPEEFNMTNSTINTLNPIWAELELLRCSARTNGGLALLMDCQKYAKYDKECFLHFEVGAFPRRPRAFVSGFQQNESVGQLMREIDCFDVRILFLTNNFEVEGGTLILTFNSMFEKELFIPRQRAVNGTIKAYSPEGTNPWSSTNQPTVNDPNDFDKRGNLIKR